MTDDGLVERLRSAVGDAHVTTDPDLLAAAAVDWTGRFRGDPWCLVRPGSTEETAAVVTACAARGVPVTTVGGNTGLVGGAVPTPGAVLLETRRLTRLDGVDEAAGTVVAGAGVTLAVLERHLRAAGWGFGVDLASRESATIGGMVATDAGGARVVLHGSMRSQVVGLEAVLADGTVARPSFGGATKDTAGYALAQLLVGSEGTLGIVTAARLRVVRPVTPAAVLLLGIAGADEVPPAVATLRALVRDAGAELAACELMTDDGLALVAERVGTRVPVATPFALLVEVAGAVDDDLLGRIVAVASSGADHRAEPVVVALDAADRRRLWALRERHTEVVNDLGVPVKLDVAVPSDRLPTLLREAGATVAEAVAGARTIVFGHAAEANLHVNVVLPGAAGAPPDPDDAAAVEDAVLGLVGELAGTVSAEHGIGRAKVRHLHLSRDDPSIAAMRAIKQALDPMGLLNPGVVLPASGVAAARREADGT